MLRRLVDLPIARIGTIFDPPGVPLVAKSATDLHTTSILVRGGPGTGKTTLALALGQAVAADGGGALVYLTTEFSPAELRFKADLLQLPARDAQLWSWNGDTREPAVAVTAGAVFVHHINPPTAIESDAEEFSETSVARKRLILEAAWQLLGMGEDAPPPSIAGVPIRAVVIDAFILPDFGGDDAEVRADLIAFIQALESVGISPILVEEVAPDSPSWFPFIVDLVFQLAHQKSPEGELERSLTCSKSRYALANAGPHAYGLSDGRPTLFPALRIAARCVLPVARPLRFALPLGGIHDAWHLVKGHQLILNPAEGVSFFDLILKTPGAVPVLAEIGSPTTLKTPAGGRVVDEGNGPTALAWEILDAVAGCNANVVIIQRISRFLHRDWWRLPVERLLVTLRALGVVAVVVDEESRLKSLASQADISFSLQPRDETSFARLDDQKWNIQLRMAQATKFEPLPLISGMLWVEREQCEPTERRSDLEEHHLTRSFLPSSHWLSENLTPLQPSLGWLLACAWVAGNVDALQPIEQFVVDEHLHNHPYSATALVRAHAMWNGIEAAEACAERLLAAASSSELTRLLPRIRAEVRLERSETMTEGITLLRELLARDDLPHAQQSEMYYNLAVMLALGSDRSGALAAVQRAHSLNPRLYPASELLSALERTTDGS